MSSYSVINKYSDILIRLFHINHLTAISDMPRRLLSDRREENSRVVPQALE